MIGATRPKAFLLWYGTRGCMQTKRNKTVQIIGFLFAYTHFCIITIRIAKLRIDSKLWVEEQWRIGLHLSSYTAIEPKVVSWAKLGAASPSFGLWVLSSILAIQPRIHSHMAVNAWPLLQGAGDSNCTACPKQLPSCWGLRPSASQCPCSGEGVDFLCYAGT